MKNMIHIIVKISICDTSEYNFLLEYNLHSHYENPIDRL